MTVYLVGAGPRDPGVVTVRGAELLARADVVVHDRLSAAELLDLAPAGAERIDVGKAPGRHTMTQDEICALLVERGRAGQHVVRLKGGDPFVFARGGEEAAALAAAGVAYEVVPGITSALAVPASAGIPVTLRYSSTSFTVVTGHEAPDAPTSVDWDAVARVGGTIVILMAVARWPGISERLVKAGLDPSTPAAAVQWGTRPDQRTVRATLSTLADHDLASPSVIVVGDVAAQDLDWFERRPLFGRSIVVTRARTQAGTLSSRLRELGARVVEVPVIAFDEPADGGAALRDAVAKIATYDWLVLTSANGVERLFAEIPDTRVLGGVRVAAIGSGTAAALARYRVVADLVPTEFVAESLLDAFPAGPGRVLLARAAVARDVLPEGLRDRGWEVDVVDAYRTVAGTPEPGALDAASTADAITFTSSSTVTGYLHLAGAERVPPVVVSIGPITSRTAHDNGLAVTVEATEHTIDGVVDALLTELGR
jgi:uroporphyrinogen III methyltransferase/synthase